MYLTGNSGSSSAGFGESTLAHLILDRCNWYYNDLCSECSLFEHATLNAGFLFDFDSFLRL